MQGDATLQADAPENVRLVSDKSVGLELEVVRHCEQRDAAKKLILKVLFLAKRGKRCV